MLNSTKIRIAGIFKESVVDGPGIRFVVFVQGCEHHCPGCHNLQTHDLEGGTEIEIEYILTMIDANPLLDGVTFSGGEPFFQAEPLPELAEQCRKRGLSVFVYTGYYYEEILERQNIYWYNLLCLTNILIDGPFVRGKGDPGNPLLRFVQSTNT
jgi:anaerobic ribonucleoside-triphosphate reductase activating protein